jgi:hypothetical protein
MVGKHIIARKRKLFDDIIGKLEDIFDVRPFNQQSAQSLLEMYLLVKATRPKTIIEIGCGTRSSTVALGIAGAELENDCTLYGVDIAPSDFQSFSKTHFPDLSFCRVVDIPTDATKFTIPDSWKRPILMLYDAHDGDIEGSVISTHAVSQWFPKLSGMTVAVHDCSVVPGDWNQPVEKTHRVAQHFSDRKIVGFGEVLTLVDWMNSNRVDFYRPGDELTEMSFDGGGSSLIYFIAP